MILLFRYLRIKHFWKWFAKKHSELEAYAGDPIRYPYELSKALRKVNRELYQEMSKTPDAVYEFVITADNNSRLFSLVDAIVTRAPGIPNWRFIALRPRMATHLLSTLEMQVDGETIRMSELFFTASCKNDRWKITIFLDLRLDLSSHIAEVVMHAVARLVGEREFHEHIRYCNFKRTGVASEDTRERIPLLGLPNFLGLN